MNKRGFTLIELLVVIAIIGILASIVMVSLSSARAKSRDARRQADIKSIQLALALYYNDNGMYPLNIYASYSAGAAPTGGLKDAYLPVVPTDPNQSVACSDGTQASCYKYSAFFVGNATLGCSAANRPPAKYHLGAVLENVNNTIDANAPVAPNGSMAGFAICNNTPSVGNFDGTSVDCSSTAGVAYGQANATERCYDQTP